MKDKWWAARWQTVVLIFTVDILWIFDLLQMSFMKRGFLKQAVQAADFVSELVFLNSVTNCNQRLLGFKQESQKNLPKPKPKLTFSYLYVKS